MRLAPLLALALCLSSRLRACTAQGVGINPSFPPPKTVLELFTSQGC